MGILLGEVGLGLSGCERGLLGWVALCGCWGRTLRWVACWWRSAVGLSLLLWRWVHRVGRLRGSDRELLLLLVWLWWV